MLEVKRSCWRAMNEVASLGITGVHDAGIDGAHVRSVSRPRRAGQLPIRIYAMLRDSPESATHAVRSAHARIRRRLQMRAVKGVGRRRARQSRRGADAGLQRSAASPRLMMYTREQMQELATLTASKGWQLNVHAIGDAGNRLVLDTLETMLTKEQRHALRPRIEHAQVIALDDIKSLRDSK
jgi:predicted amidohydrolase YtcJ